MSGGRAPDVLVVGAGIVGAACAAELARAGLVVHLLERSFVAAEATAAAMGHVVVMDDSEAQFALGAASRALWDELAEELPPDCESERSGTLWIAADELQRERLESKRRFYSERGVTAEVLDARALAEAEPELRSDLTGALHVPGDRVLYPPAAARFLVRQACAHEAVLVEGCQVLELRSDGALCIENGGLEVRSAGLVVVATGAAAARLVPGLPIEPRRGHLAITDRYPGFCRHQLVELGYLTSAHGTRQPSVAFNVQPRATGQLLVGSSREYVGLDPRPNPPLRARMLLRAQHFLPRLERLQVLRTWVGFRPATPDSLPFVGRHPQHENLWIAAGHEGLGIATALGSARLLADLLLNRTPLLDPQPFALSPQRLDHTAPAVLDEPVRAGPAAAETLRVPATGAGGAAPALPRPAPPPLGRSEVEITVDGRHLRAPAGVSLAAALASAGVSRFRGALDGTPRGPVCAMGVCHECRVTLDGEPHRRACLELCREGQQVSTT